MASKLYLSKVPKKQNKQKNPTACHLNGSHGVEK